MSASVPVLLPVNARSLGLAGRVTSGVVWVTGGGVTDVSRAGALLDTAGDVEAGGELDDGGEEELTTGVLGTGTDDDGAGIVVEGAGVVRGTEDETLGDTDGHGVL